jgi:site-specific DNA recombinase
VGTPRTAAAVYCRISADKTGAGLGVERQEADCRELAARLGWTVVETFVDNDISAYSGKPRPRYRAMLDAIRSGRVDAVIAWHTDRIHRSPVELEEYIEVCNGTRDVPTHCVKAGELDLSTASGRMVARQLGAVARYESEHRSERVRAAGLQRAQAGHRAGGPRPFGFAPDGVTLRPTVEQLRQMHERLHAQRGDKHPVPDENALVEEAERIGQEPELIKRAAEQVLNGVSLRAVAATLNEAGARTALKGRRWDRLAVREMLLKPRNAGLRQHDGEIIGKACWPAVIDEDQWRGMVALLTKEDRRVSPIEGGRRWLGSGMYRCGGCGRPTLRVSTSGKRASARYRCEGGKDVPLLDGATGHVTRSAGPLDEFIEALIVERLSRPDAAELLRPARPGIDVGALRSEANAARLRIREIAEMLGDGELSRADAVTARARAVARRDRAEAAIAAASEATPLRGLADAEDPTEAWERLDLGRRRAVLDHLMIVTVHSAGYRSGPHFDPSSVETEWKIDN